MELVLVHTLEGCLWGPLLTCSPGLSENLFAAQRSAKSLIGEKPIAPSSKNHGCLGSYS